MYQLDTYTFKARLLPTFIVIFPLVLVPVVIYPNSIDIWKFLAAICVSFGATALLAQIGRDKGKKAEPGLFQSWGGKPTTLMLSHQHSLLSKSTLQRYHSKLGQRIVGIAIPTALEERQNLDKAFEVYDSCTDYLREQTRDQSKFRLVFAENINYGFRRNLWAMKEAGVFLSFAGLFISAGIFAYGYTDHRTVAVLPLIAGLICSALLSLWLLRINPEWVKVAADAYAERLLATLDSV